MQNKASIFWCTGMSGAGKTTLAEYAKHELSKNGLLTLILDGDVIRDKHKVKLGFGREDVEENNINIANLCRQERYNYDVIIVPVISPVSAVRSLVKGLLSPKYHLIYIMSKIESLRERDPKGLYAKTDSGEINDLIGYSDMNPYEAPDNYNLAIDTSNSSDINRSKILFKEYILNSLHELP